MKPIKYSDLSVEELERANTKNGKKIVSYSRKQDAGKPGINFYIFSDGSELCEDDNGKKATWPGAE